LLRAGVDDVGAGVSDACSGIARQPLGPTVISRACEIGSPDLRSLDAIHLAAAVDLGATEMLTFDRRLAAAATAVGVKAIP
jgi:predicted nucleic acid-binding protein